MNKKMVITAAVVGVIVIAGLTLAITRTLAGGGRISIPLLTTTASPATTMTTTNKAAPPTSTSTSATPTTAAPTSNHQQLQLSQQQQQNQQQQNQQPANVVTVSIEKGASNMGNKAYSPNPIQIQRGTTVVWRNDDTTLHTAVSGKGPSDTSLGKMFESAPIAPGKTFSYKFDAVGTYDYFCTLHPAMVGTVVVK
jgi:plastocyanin